MARFIDLVFKEYEREALETLLNRPDDSFTVNQVAKQASASYNSIKSFLNQLRDYRIVQFEKKGNSRLVRYNTDNKYHDTLLKMFTVDESAGRKTAESYAAEVYEKFSDDIHSIALFGSTARGVAEKDSDIDILILVDDNEKDIEEEARRIAQEMSMAGKEIVPVVEVFKEFQENLKRRKRFEKSVLKDAILLEGEGLDEKS